ncbi:MAG: alpha-hydroxy acid oxidase [Candidatus Sphingomonas colombiensis]|nr:alpha-hydroxy acid oxidase [Sphingomonas sp.]WEK43974.1 MAG: alpha-hydroxy acid oxidase [Sphingomonas sp.]
MAADTNIPCDFETMRRMAQRRLPRFAFDFIDGGALRERALARNAAALDEIRLLPRVLTGATTRDLTTNLLGQQFAAPFGIAPIGMANLVRPGTDLALASAAAHAEIGYTLSTAATTPLETIAEVAPRSWFQLYVGRDSAITDDLLRRAEAAGYPALIVTADVPAPGKRLRDLRNRFTLPLKPSMGMAFDLMRHPGWALAIATGGAPRFANLEAYSSPGSSTQSLAELMAGQSSARLDWDLLTKIRERWPRKLVLKGVLRPDDAQRAVAIGIDAIGISNHGGRQLDASPAPVEMIAPIRAAIGGRVPLIVDGGVKCGEDIARCLALGADFVLLGRAFLYSVAAMGKARGPAALIDMLRDELDRAMTQLGCSRIADIDRGLLFDPAGGAPDSCGEPLK